jgi:hypothetical protein
VLKKKIWANFQRIIELFTKKIVKKVLKIWSWDPGSEVRIPDPGVKKAPDPGSRSATLIEGSGTGTGSIPLTNGSGSGFRRPKNMWIRNTGRKMENTQKEIFFYNNAR